MKIVKSYQVICFQVNVRLDCLDRQDQEELLDRKVIMVMVHSDDKDYQDYEESRGQ
jgi:hypothetical protein